MDQRGLIATDPGAASVSQVHGPDREWYDAGLCRLLDLRQSLTAASLLSSYVSLYLAGSIWGRPLCGAGVEHSGYEIDGFLVLNGRLRLWRSR